MIKIYTAKEKIKKKKLSFLNKNISYSVVLYSNSFNSFEPYNNNNINIKYSSNNSTIETKKNYDNDIGSKDIFVVNDLLGKKTKIIFNTIKQTEKKPTFFTTKYMPKKEDILRENKSKEEKKNICHKNNLFQTYKYFYLDEQKKGHWRKMDI